MFSQESWERTRLARESFVNLFTNESNVNLIGSHIQPDQLSGQFALHLAPHYDHFFRFLGFFLDFSKAGQPAFYVIPYTGHADSGSRSRGAEIPKG